MGLTRSLTAGATSLRAHQSRMDVIANNIANVNTIGYKSSRTTFVDQLSQLVTLGKPPGQVGQNPSGGINPLQFGLGVKLGAVTMDMSQGILDLTNRPFDLAIQGAGFFVYSLNGTTLYSRAGAISMDRDGWLVDSNSGANLQGYNIEMDANGKMVKDADNNNVLNRRVESLKIDPNVISEPRQTQLINMIGNLDSEMEIGDSRKTSIKIFDRLGSPHNLTLTFTKTADNEFSITGEVDGTALTLSETITFNTDGTLDTPLDITITASDLNTAIGSSSFDDTTPKDITVKLADANNLISGLTQFAGGSTATAIGQDGYQSGELVNLSVDPTGKILGTFTNGQTEILGQVVVAKFTNPTGLTKQGGNFYSVSPNSGLANIGTAGELFPSTTISAGTLEESNVDMTREFTDMISTQRAFEAAARTVTVSDQMLAEVNLLKR